MQGSENYKMERCKQILWKIVPFFFYWDLEPLRPVLGDRPTKHSQNFLGQVVYLGPGTFPGPMAGTAVHSRGLSFQPWAEHPQLIHDTTLGRE